MESEKQPPPAKADSVDVAGAVAEWEALAEVPVVPAGVPETRLAVEVGPAGVDSVEASVAEAGAEQAAGPAIARR